MLRVLSVVCLFVRFVINLVIVKRLNWSRKRKGVNYYVCFRN